MNEYRLVSGENLKTSSVQPITAGTVFQLAFNLGFDGTVPPRELVGNCGRNFLGYYFQGVICQMFSSYNAQNIDKLSLRPDVVIEYEGEKSFLEVKSGYKGNGIIFRPMQFQKFVESPLYHNCHVVFIFHKSRKFESKFKKCPDLKDINIGISSIFIFPAKMLVDLWSAGRFSHLKWSTDKIGRISCKVKESLFAEIFGESSLEKFTNENIYSVGCDISRCTEI